ncbi:cadherin-related family member 2-like [Anguilla rostrata]
MKEASLMLLFFALFFQTASGNTSPIIHMTLINLREDIPVGHYAFTIQASDAENDPLTFSINGENRFYFSVNPNSGIVHIKSPLDREEKVTFNVELSVYDGMNDAVRKTLIVILHDANDNRPIFVDAPFNKDVSENTAVDTVLFQVTARDADYGLASLVSYKIDDVVPNDGMNLFSISERTGEVKLIGRLNYTSKSTFYQLKINASDGGGPLWHSHVFQSSVAFAFITVIDVPDLVPQFLNVPYSVTVNEHTTVGQTVFQVQAIDPDTGVNDKIRFKIQNSNVPDLFEIDEESGNILVKTIFDREDLLYMNAVVKLQVLASETKPNVYGTISNTTTDVQINIGDINDNKPRFYNCQPECNFKEEVRHFRGITNEQSSVGVPVGDLNIIARDLDEGVNSRFELHLQGPDKNAFSVSPPWAISSSPVQIFIRNPSDVDYEKKKTMIVEIVAIDTSKTADCCSTAVVTIQIKDINDNNPAFKNETYYLEVDEHSRTGKVVATITAIDPDTEDVGKITYRLLPESILKYFDVNPKSGRIKVKNNRLLDREVRAVYSATLQAIDSAENMGTTVLEITLNDINDKIPTMARDSYIGFVKEESNAELQLQIQAFDGDEPGTDNSEIKYKIEKSHFSGNFSINARTGLLKNKGPLDRESIEATANGVIQLNVTASDMGHPSLSSWVTVTINVEDMNDNTPTFKSPSYEFYVSESEKGIFVGSVFAHDMDQTEMNNRISFRIADGSFGNFLIIAYSKGKDQGYMGNITVDPDIALDYEQHRMSYNLKIEATDLGQKSDVVLVTVNVMDVNDECPTFPHVMIMNVKENTTGLGEVGHIVGVDVDTNHSLIYKLLTSSCRCSGIMGPCEEEWFKLETTGAVVVNEKFVIDYEMCDQVQMEVQAVDVFTEKGENHSIPEKLTIYIDDINDNIPRFIISETLFVVVTEGTEKGTEVARVAANDLDSGKNMKIKFEVLAVEIIYADNRRESMGKIFYAETTTRTNDYLGTIRSLGTLDSNLKGQYLVTVQAKDCGEPPLETTTKLMIYTVDKSFRVGLRFESRVDEINRNINSIRGALIAATRATVHIIEIVSESQEQRASGVTLLGSYFVYPNGSAINSDDVERILQEDFYHANILQKYGLTYIVSTGPEVKEFDPVLLALICLVASLLIALVVMLMSFVYTQRSYKRKLKAAKAMNSAAKVSTENHKPRAVVPGTNRYTIEGANPVLNLNFEMTTDLGFDEDGDRISLNSFDLDLNMTEKDTVPMMIIQEEEEENGNEFQHIEPLTAALAQLEMEKGCWENNSFVNPALSTTDL